MSSANVRLKLHFDLDLAVPAQLSALDHERLCKALATALGATVIQGLPVIAGKQLAKAGVTVVGSHHHLDAVSLVMQAVDRRRIIDVAPHLTDREVVLLATKAAAKLPASPVEAAAYLRRQALALVNEYRLVPCSVAVLLSSGKPARIEGRLNLTNGHIFLGEEHRQTRLQANQGPLQVSIDGTSIVVAADSSGHTLTGPVLDVQVPVLVPHRDALIARWQAG